MKKRIILSAFLIITLLISVMNTGCGPSGTDETGIIKVNLTAPQTAYSIPTIIAIEKGLFKDQNLDVQINYVKTGKIATDDLLGGKADFANIVETNIAFAGYQNPSIQVICNIEKVFDAAIIARKDRGIEKESDLKGKKIGVMLATTSQVFANRFFANYNITKDCVVVVNLLPPAMQAAIIEGSSVDAISVWQPYIYNVQKALGDNAITFTNRSIYTGYMNLAANNDFTAKNPDAAQRMLKAYIAAEEFLKNNKDESIDIVARVLKLDKEIVKSIWGQYEFNISLEKELFDATLAEGQWIKQTQEGFTTKDVPDYTRFFNIEPLKNIDDNRVKW